MAFPLTQGQMEDWIHEPVFIKESGMADYLREQRFVTAADLRREGYASGDDVRQTVMQLVHACTVQRNSHWCAGASRLHSRLVGELLRASGDREH